MKIIILMATVLLTACLQIKAQTLATEYKGTASGNPISGIVFCADPTAIEYDAMATAISSRWSFSQPTIW